MKTLLVFIAPAVKAILATIGFMVGLGWGSYQAVSTIAKAEAKAVKEEVLLVRGIDMKHIDKRFDKLEVLIKESR